MKLSSLFAAALALAASSSIARADVSARLLTELDASEVSEAQLFHHGHLWVAKSRSQSLHHFRVELYASDGTLKGTVELAHSPSQIQPYGKDRVLVLGRNSSGASYSILSLDRAGKPKVAKTYRFSTAYLPDHFSGTTSPHYYSEPGGGAVWRHGFWGMKKVATISAPGQLFVDGNSIFVVERRNGGYGDENLRKINLTTGVTDPTFKTAYRNGLTDLLDLPGTGLLAVSETGARQVLLVDKHKNQHVETLKVAGHPRGLAKYGRCLLVASFEPNRVTAFDLSSAQKSKVAEMDLSHLGTKFARAMNLSVDPESGRVYVRSTTTCYRCPQSYSSVVIAEDASRDLQRACAK